MNLSTRNFNPVNEFGIISSCDDWRELAEIREDLTVIKSFFKQGTAAAAHLRMSNKNGTVFPFLTLKDGLTGIRNL